MLLGSTQTCFKCSSNFGWEYTTPDTDHILNLDDDTVSIASAKLVNSKDEKYDITVKCPKCNSLNKFSMVAKWHDKE